MYRKPRQKLDLIHQDCKIQIDPDKIGDVIGKQGKVINAIIDETSVKIEISDEGAVSISGFDKEGIEKAIDIIRVITTDFEKDKIYR